MLRTLFFLIMDGIYHCMSSKLSLVYYAHSHVVHIGHHFRGGTKLTNPIYGRKVTLRLKQFECF